MAGFSSNNKQTGAITGINVTPLVDITLVLLIIFMVTARIVVARAIPVDLPRAATGGEVQHIFTVAIGSDGALRVDGASVEGDRALLDAARTSASQNPELRAVINADGAVPHRNVMHVVDIIRQAGIARIAFGVEPTKPVEEKP